MENKLTREQVKAILDGAPQGADKKVVFNKLVEKGYKIEGYNDQPAPEEKSLVSKATDVVKDTVSSIGLGIGGAGLTAIDYLGRKGVESLDENNPLFNALGVSKQQAINNLSKAQPLQEQFKKEMYSGENPDLTKGGEVAGQIASLAVPASKVGAVVSGGAKALTGVGKIGKLASKAAGGAAEGLTFDVGTKLTEGQTDNLAPGAATAVGGVLPVVGATVSPLLKIAGKGLKEAGYKVIDLVTPVSKNEAARVQNYLANNDFISRISNIGQTKTPQTLSKTITEGGFAGTREMLGVQAQKAQKNLWSKVIEPALKQSNIEVDLPQFFTKVQDDIIASTPELGRQKQLINALDSVKEDYANKASVSLAELQKLKEGWAEFLPEKVYRGENIAGALNEIRNKLSQESRSTIYGALGKDVQKAYTDYGNLMGLKELGITARTGQKLKGGTGSWVTDIATMLVTPVGTVGGQVLYKTGKGVEFLGNALKEGIKNPTVADVLGISDKITKGTLAKTNE
jgi:hypothetical protein